MASLDPPYLSSRLRGFGTTIFTEMTQLAQRHDAINLGQGAPDFDGPEEIKEAAVRAIREGHNQYCRMYGIPELNRAIASHEKRFYDLDYDPETEITVYSGATEALHCVFQALFEAGDEILAFEPFYDSYPAGAAMAGAHMTLIPLKPAAFSFQRADLERARTPRTRAVLLNTPHNPTGRVFSDDELETLASFCREHDLLMISDEVYEHIVFGRKHRPIATLPGMAERTVTVSSTGKTFSMTGWKVGYSCAPAAITAALRTAHQFVTFCNSAPFQPAMALALELPDSFFEGLRGDYEERRRVLCEGLSQVGFDVLEPEGTYFVLADIRPLGHEDGERFCRELPAKVGVAAIPVASFCRSREIFAPWVRFGFCKQLEILEEGVERLSKLTGPGGAA